MRVVVVGAGIIGTCSAVRLKARWPALDVKMVAEKISPNTTSDIAAGWWEPHLDPDTLPERVVDWAGQTYRLLSDLARGKEVPELGASLSTQLSSCVRMMSEIEVDSDSSLLHPAWAKLVAGFRELDQSDLAKLGMAGEGSPLYSRSYISYTLEPALALPAMYGWLQGKGVAVEERRLGSLKELEGEAEIVINCCGLGASDLVGDSAMEPVSGHVLRVEAPWVGSVINDGRPDSWAYVIPQRGSVVLGSVDTRGRWDTTPRPGDREKILARCERLVPGLQETKVLGESVGLRPCRRGGVRLAVEEQSGMFVVHNYGHGGSGVTLSWGCAGEVVSLVGGFLADRAAGGME